MENISSTGLSIWISSLKTFPLGFSVTHFSDDMPPLDVDKVRFGNAEIDLNGKLVFQNKPNIITIKLSVIPRTQSDINLSILADANYQSDGKIFDADLVTMTISYADGDSKTLINGRLVEGDILDSSTSGGRLKSKEYVFVFPKKIN